MATGISSVFPQQFGRYILTAKIAMGGMAEIFRAKSLGAEGFEKVVVIKRILPHFCEEEGFVTMFKDEAKVASHLNHANVVQIFDFDEVEGLFYIAMEYVEGRDLKRVLDQGAKLGKALSIAQAVYIMIEASKGLDYAHKRVVDGQPLSIIHRDVSPHNVMVSFNGEVKIMDFGIAKAAARSTKTRVGTVKGKCAYMSPEQARGKNLDPRSDLFALGVCLWEMLTGKRLFVGDSDFETLNNVLRAEVPPPSELNPEVPKELDTIVLKALAREVDQRHKDVGAFVNELNRWFFSAVPDPDAVNLNGYMHELFGEEIQQLRQEAQSEAQMMEGVRKGVSNVAVKKPGTGSQPAAQAADDERTMALPGASLQVGDSDRTMALPDAMSQVRMNAATLSPQASPMAPAPAKSNVGLIVGILFAVLAAGAIAAYLKFGAGNGEPPPAAAVAAPAAPAEKPKLKLSVKAAGAVEILVDGKTECMGKEVCEVAVEAGKHKVIAKNDAGKGVDQEVEVASDGQVVELKLPVVEKKPDVPPPAAAQGPAVLLKIQPENATITVNGKPVVLDKGNASLPGTKVGDKLIVIAQAEGFKPETKEFEVKNPSAELFELKLQRDKPAPTAGQAEPKAKEPAAAAGPGKVKINAKPWAKIEIKGKDYELTPKEVTLPAGKYTVTLTKGSVRKTVGVTVRAGETASVSVDMTEE